MSTSVSISALRSSLASWSRRSVPWPTEISTLGLDDDGLDGSWPCLPILIYLILRVRRREISHPTHPASPRDSELDTNGWASACQKFIDGSDPDIGITVDAPLAIITDSELLIEPEGLARDGLEWQTTRVVGHRWGVHMRRLTVG